MLPANWTKYTTAEGKDYYHNSETNQTQWDVPTLPPPAPTFPQPQQMSTQVTKSTTGYGSTKPDSQPLFGSRVPCACCIPGLGFLTAGFDVDTSDVKSRLLATISIVNIARSFNQNQPAGTTSENLETQTSPATADLAVLFGSKPDLYGPFWIATTAILTATIAANSSSWLQTADGIVFFANYALMGELATFIYSSFGAVIGIIWLLSWKIPNLHIDLALVSCVYGYSMLPLCIVALLSPFFAGLFQTLAIFVGFFWSIFICYRLLWLPTLGSLERNARLTLFGVPCLVHGLTYAFFKFLM